MWSLGTLGPAWRVREGWIGALPLGLAVSCGLPGWRQAWLGRAGRRRQGAALSEHCALPASPPHPFAAADESGKLRVTLPFLQAMLEAFRGEHLIHRRYAFEIILQVGAGCAAVYCFMGGQLGGAWLASRLAGWLAGCGSNVKWRHACTPPSYSCPSAAPTLPTTGASHPQGAAAAGGH